MGKYRSDAGMAMYLRNLADLLDKGKIQLFVEETKFSWDMSQYGLTIRWSDLEERDYLRKYFSSRFTNFPSEPE